MQNSPYLTLCYKSSQKICIYLYQGIKAMLPKHHLIHAAVIHIVLILLRSPMYSLRRAELYILQSHYCYCYSTISALAHPQQKTYTNCMLADSSLVIMLGIWTPHPTATQHSHSH
jgi:hypothetical protein